MTTQQYSLKGGMKTVAADLNGDSINFTLSFLARSKNGEPFYVAAVNQTMLDNTPEQEFRLANGSIDGKINENSNMYQNYFLLLKSEHPCEVDVTVEKIDIQPQPIPYDQNQIPYSKSAMAPPVRESSTNWKMILLTIVLIGGSIVLYYLYKQKSTVSKTSDDSSITESVSSPITIAPLSSSAYPTSSFNESLLNRLNSLPIK